MFPSRVSYLPPLYRLRGAPKVRSSKFSYPMREVKNFEYYFLDDWVEVSHDCADDMYCGWAHRGLDLLRSHLHNR